MVFFDFFHLFDDPDTKIFNFVLFLKQPFWFYITIPLSSPFSPPTHPTFPHLSPIFMKDYQLFPLNAAQVSLSPPLDMQLCLSLHITVSVNDITHYII